MKIRLDSLTLLLLFLSFSFLTGCNQENEACNADFYDLGAEGMQPDVEYLFNQPLEHKSYNVNLVIRYTNKCRLKSFPLNMEYYSFSGDSVEYEIRTIPITHNMDSNKKDDFIILNKGNFGVYEQQVELLKNFEIGDGSYITLSTPVNVAGLISLGLIYNRIQD